jgi:hypothetical protein
LVNQEDKMKVKSKHGLLLASAAAALFASGVTLAAEGSAGAAEAKVHCGGVNQCKGKSDCATASNGCAGQNSCKGKGFKDMSKAECEKAGGKVTEGSM